VLLGFSAHPDPAARASRAGSRLEPAIGSADLAEIDDLVGILIGAGAQAGALQTAASLGVWSLVGCTVAPGFAFAGFEMAPPGWQPTARRVGSPS
jgi:hypothetical protein